MKLFLVVDKGAVKSVHLKRRPAIEEASDRLMSMVEVDADISVVSFRIENGIVDLCLFGSAGHKSLIGKHGD